jgi:predicted nucleic acid-binding protein
MTDVQGCVLDASAVLALFIPEDHSTDVESLVLEHRSASPPYPLMVPDLLFAECANVLRKRVLRGEKTSEQALADLADLRKLALDSVPTEELVEDALMLATAYSVSAYDACYVALSDRTQLPLVTGDKRLALKISAGHQVISLSRLAGNP